MATHDFSQIGVVMERRAKDFRGAAQASVQFIAEAAFNRAVDETPVDSSLAVSNYIASHGAPSGAIRSPVVSSVKGSGARSAKNRVKAEIRTVVNAYKLSRPMFLVNNVPYIGVLNDGDRKHKAANMLQKGVQSARARARKVRILREVCD